MNLKQKQKLFDEADSILIFKNDNGKLPKLIEKGLDVNMENECGQTIVERASCFSISFSTAAFE